MSRRALVSGCLLAAILWLAIALIFAAGVAVGRATAASRAVQNPSGVSGAAPDVATEDAASGQPGAPLDLASVPATASGDVRPVGAPSPAGRTEASERLTPMPAASLGSIADVVFEGIASTYGPGWDGWIAWPDGPGYRLHVCGPAACRDVTSNDAGPDLAMQRAGRVIDLDVRTFERVCGVSWRMGRCPVVVTVLRVPR